MARSTTDRLAEKTFERQFFHEMETDFELAPAASRVVEHADREARLRHPRR